MKLTEHNNIRFRDPSISVMKEALANYNTKRGKKLKYEEFYKIIYSFHRYMFDYMLRTKNPISLMRELGKMTVIAKKPRRNMINRISFANGKTVKFDNNATNELICKFVYTNYLSFNLFPLKGIWCFELTKALKTKMAKDFRENWPTYPLDEHVNLKQDISLEDGDYKYDEFKL